MLPTTLARGRATARGYGELLTMLNTPGSIPGLNTYRYSPYTIPNATGSASAVAAQAAAHAAAVAAAASPQPNTVTVTSTQQRPTVTPIISQAAAQVTPPNAAQPTSLTPAHLQQLQLLGLVGQIPSAQPPVTTSAGPLINNSPLAAQLLALNNQAVAAAAVAAQAGTLTGVQAGQPCKQRAALPTALIDGSAVSGHAAGQPATVSNGLNYSMNDLINLQGLQFDAASAANFQVPVGL